MILTVERGTSDEGSGKGEKRRSDGSETSDEGIEQRRNEVTRVKVLTR